MDQVEQAFSDRMARATVVADFEHAGGYIALGAIWFVLLALVTVRRWRRGTFILATIGGALGLGVFTVLLALSTVTPG